MSNGHSLEEERQAILERMQMRRESYRRVLTGGGDLDQVSVEQDGHAVLTHARASHAQAYSPLARPIPTRFPRSTLMRVVTEHPLWCALGVAAIVAIGPKRIMRTVATSGTVLSTLTARNQSNIDLIGKVLTMAGAYVQGRTDPDHH